MHNSPHIKAHIKYAIYAVRRPRVLPGATNAQLASHSLIFRCGTACVLHCCGMCVALHHSQIRNR